MTIILVGAFLALILYMAAGPLFASAALDDSIATIVAARTLGRLKENAVMSRIVSRDWDNEIAEHGDTIQISKRQALSSPTDLHQGGGTSIPLDSDLTTEQPGDDPVSIILNNFEGVPFKIGSFTRAVARPNQLLGFTMDAAKGLATRIDQTLLIEAEDNAAAANNFTPGTDVLVADLITADKLLNVSLAPTMDRRFVWHPRAKAKLIAKGIFIGHEVTSNVAVSVQDGDPTVRMALMDAALGRRLGFDHYMDQNVGLVGTTADTQANIFFASEGLVLATRPLDRAPDGAGAITATMEEDGMGLRVSMQWNVRQGNTMDVLVDFLWGTKAIRPEFIGRAQTSLTS